MLSETVFRLVLGQGRLFLSPAMLENFQPVFMLPLFKVLGQMVASQFQEFLEETGFQSRFRLCCGTEIAN